MHSSNSIAISRSVGTVAAFLTGLEFIVGIIVILCLNVVLRGLWLFNLYWTGKVSFTKRELKYISIQKEAIAFAIALWFVLSVALVENSLESTYIVSQNEVHPENCARTDSLYDYHQVQDIRPPKYYALDDWSLNTVNDVNCEKGFHAIHFEGLNGKAIHSDKNSLSAPTCRNISSKPNHFFPELDQGIAFGTISHMYNGRNGFIFEDPYISIFPQEIDIVPENSAEEFFGEKYKGIPSCKKFNITSFPIRYFVKWDISGINDFHVANVVLKDMCQEINTTTIPRNISSNVVENCFDKFINISCIMQNSTNSQQSTVNLKNVSFYAAKSTESDEISFDEGATYATRAVICLNVDLKVTYHLIPSKPLLNRWDKKAGYIYFKELLVQPLMLMPIKFEVTSGKCVPTIPGIGLSALIHTLNAKWKNNTFINIKPETLYQAYLVSMAKSFFPHQFFKRLKTVNETQNSTQYTCTLKDVIDGTLLKKNFSFYLLIGILILSGILLILAIVFLSILPRQAWNISTSDTLQIFNPMYRSLGKEHEACVPSKADRKNNPKKEAEENTEITMELVTDTQETKHFFQRILNTKLFRAV